MSHAVASSFLALDAHAKTLESVRTLDLFAADPSRFDNFSVRLDDLLYDYSKHKVTRETLDLLGKVFQYRTCDGAEPGRASGR